MTTCPRCDQGPAIFDLDRLAELYPVAESDRYRVLGDPDYRERPRSFDFLSCHYCGHRWAERRP